MTHAMTHTSARKCRSGGRRHISFWRPYQVLRAGSFSPTCSATWRMCLAAHARTAPSVSQRQCCWVARLRLLITMLYMRLAAHACTTRCVSQQLTRACVVWLAYIAISHMMRGLAARISNTYSGNAAVRSGSHCCWHCAAAQMYSNCKRGVRGNVHMASPE